jgi:putative glutamine amidotransferase
VTAPRIAITAWRRRLPTPLGERTTLDALDPGYAAGIAAAGGIPLILSREAASPGGALDGMDALLLSGGGDVAPATYGAPDEGASEDVDPEADAWELALVAEARSRQLPTLGICRGMQLLAIAHGGALAQGVDPSLHPGMGALPPEESLARRHPVDLERGSAIAGVFGTSRLSVNTLHHQAVSDPGTLTVTARAPDGTIEAVEAGDWPALGVLWHPEKMDDAEQRRLFELLVARARG